MRRSLRALPALLVLTVAVPASADDRKADPQALTPRGAVLASLDDAKKVPVLRKWSGKIADEKLQKQSPQAGVIADKMVFETLWNAWRPQEEVPAIDFAKELVLVAVAPGPNQVEMTPQLDDKGDLQFLARATLVDGPGFGYQIAVISREGVKTVKGKPLAEK
jgi:hypothetical protein